MQNDTRLRLNKITKHKKQIELQLKIITEANKTALTLLNSMYCDSDFSDIDKDVLHVLNGNFCNGEHLLVGLLDTLEQMSKQISKAA